MKVDEASITEAPGSCHAGPRATGMSREPVNAVPLDVRAIRGHFGFPGLGRVVTNNAASTQPPAELLALYASLGPGYENVHRGQSGASQAMTALFEESYDTIARFVGAPGRECIALYRNTTEAINAVMYSLLTEFRDGDNVVTTLMEHNSNYVPWYGLCREILPRLGRQVQCRLARFDPVTGELDLDHLASLIDARTKLVCCTGASNFLGTRPPLDTVRALADASGYVQPTGERRSYLLVDGAQLVPGSFADVRVLDVDFLAFSFHKLLAPFGVGVLYGRQHLLESSQPFLYGGDMIAEGQVFPDQVGYNVLPWKYAAGTPNILGTIASAQAVRLLLDLALSPRRSAYFGTGKVIERAAAQDAMGRLPLRHARSPRPRPGPARCRLSFYLYNTPAEVDTAVAAVTAIATGRHRPTVPCTGASPSRPGTVRPVRRFGSSHPAGVSEEACRARRRRPPGRWRYRSSPSAPYHKRTKSAQYRHQQKAAQSPGRAEPC
jgi:cysteine desulfurase / selenocysteine lyase